MHGYFCSAPTSCFRQLQNYLSSILKIILVRKDGCIPPLCFFTSEFIFSVGIKCAFEVTLLPCEIRDYHRGDAKDPVLLVSVVTVHINYTFEMWMNKSDRKNEIYIWLMKLNAKKYCTLQSKETEERLFG